MRTYTQLRKTIIDATIELMDHGGTTPWQTAEYLLGEHPELCARFDEDEIIELCEEIQKAELPVDSYRFQQLFRIFNVQYFGGRLSAYRVQMVFDVHAWTNEYYSSGAGLDEFLLGYINIENRRIFLRRSEFPMERILIHEMTHAATTGDHDDAFYKETRRLRELGAPVCPGDDDLCFPDPNGPLQLRLPLIKVYTADQIFGSTLPSL
jgi:hypothetical protein